MCKRNKADSYHFIVFPILNVLLWTAGIIMGIEISNVFKGNVESLHIIGFIMVYAVFLSEIAIGFLDISLVNRDKKFHADVFKFFGFIIINLVITIVLCLVCWSKFYSSSINDGIGCRVMLQILLIVMVMSLKYFMIYINNNIGKYLFDIPKSVYKDKLEFNG